MSTTPSIAGTRQQLPQQITDAQKQLAALNALTDTKVRAVLVKAARDYRTHRDNEIDGHIALEHVVSTFRHNPDATLLDRAMVDHYIDADENALEKLVADAERNELGGKTDKTSTTAHPKLGGNGAGDTPQPGAWKERKKIKGQYYWYWRWRDANGVKRSQYIGKADNQS